MISELFVTGKVRILYPNFFEPYAPPGSSQQAKYSCVILIPKSDEKQIARFREVLNNMITRIKSKYNNKLPAGFKFPLRDGDTERDDDVFKGHYFINVKSKLQPQVFDSQVQPIIDPSEIYSGIWGRVSMKFFDYDFSGNRGISAMLYNVQKIADGERIGGTSAGTEFTPVSTTQDTDTQEDSSEEVPF